MIWVMEFFLKQDEALKIILICQISQSHIVQATLLPKYVCKDESLT